MGGRCCKDMYGRDFSLQDAQTCVGKGWNKLIESCYNICLENDVEIWQIKEKFGGLRFYVGSAPNIVHEIIDQVEGESYNICELCGRDGKVGGKSWLKCLCSDCRKEHSNENI